MSVSGVLFSVGVCACDLLMFLRGREGSNKENTVLLRLGFADRDL